VNSTEELQRGCAQLGISLGADEQNKLLGYLALLRKWNKVYNLTAIRDEQRMVSHHLLDSLAAMPHLWEGRWLDVGCGAGLPGLVMAVMRPNWPITLLDSNSKKTSFVQQAIIELGLQNARVYCARVENWESAEKFDGIISRAFSELGIFFRNSRHLLARNGRWVAMKGVSDHELAGVPGQCRIEKVIPLQVPGLNAARSLVIASCEESNTT
jgi:16S rRNA (guanine527-N7)-methyltransferase